MNDQMKVLAQIAEVLEERGFTEVIYEVGRSHHAEHTSDLPESLFLSVHVSVQEFERKQDPHFPRYTYTDRRVRSCEKMRLDQPPITEELIAGQDYPDPYDVEDFEPPLPSYTIKPQTLAFEDMLHILLKRVDLFGGTVTMYEIADIVLSEWNEDLDEAEGVYSFSFVVTWPLQ